MNGARSRRTSATAPPPTALIVATATTPNAETPASVATIAPVVAKAARPTASATRSDRVRVGVRERDAERDG